jgi:hypothetical protein
MENINMKKNKIILIVALVLSLSANADNDAMAGLLILKQLENLSDERIVLPFKRNPYYQCL